MAFFDKSKNRISLIYHILVWVILCYLYIHFMQNFIPLKQAIVRVSVYLVFIACVFYLHTYFLVPRFFNKKKILFYIAAIGILLFISVVANNLYKQHFEIAFSAITAGHKVPGHSNYVLTGTISTLMISFIAWFIIKYKAQALQKNELEAQKNSAELAMLKSQINPHFLFNTLNNIYALSLAKAEPVVSEMILSLSEINRYMLYETEPDYVPLNKEVAYLNSYIELEKLRCENISNIKFSVSPEIEHVKISPLLLIPFVENAFKHSRIADETDAWIEINLSVENNILVFNCENSVPVSAFKKDKTSGIGLENVKRRLLILYPNKHELSISQPEHKFIVDLKLHLY